MYVHIYYRTYELQLVSCFCLIVCSFEDNAVCCGCYLVPMGTSLVTPCSKVTMSVTGSWVCLCPEGHLALVLQLQEARDPSDLNSL